MRLHTRGQNWLSDQREVCWGWQKTSLYICYSNCWEGPLYQPRCDVIFIPKARKSTAACKAHFNPPTTWAQTEKNCHFIFRFQNKFSTYVRALPNYIQFSSNYPQNVTLSDHLLCFLCVSVNGAVTCYDYMAFVTDKHMSTETLWHDNDRVRLTKYAKILSQCQFVHRKFRGTGVDLNTYFQFDLLVTNSTVCSTTYLLWLIVWDFLACTRFLDAFQWHKTA